METNKRVQQLNDAKIALRNHKDLTALEIYVDKYGNRNSYEEESNEVVNQTLLKHYFKQIQNLTLDALQFMALENSLNQEMVISNFEKKDFPKYQWHNFELGFNFFETKRVLINRAYRLKKRGIVPDIDDVDVDEIIKFIPITYQDKIKEILKDNLVYTYYDLLGYSEQEMDEFINIFHRYVTLIRDAMNEFIKAKLKEKENE